MVEVRGVDIDRRRRTGRRSCKCLMLLGGDVCIIELLILADMLFPESLPISSSFLLSFFPRRYALHHNSAASHTSPCSQNSGSSTKSQNSARGTAAHYSSPPTLSKSTDPTAAIRFDHSPLASILSRCTSGTSKARCLSPPARWWDEGKPLRLAVDMLSGNSLTGCWRCNSLPRRRCSVLRRRYDWREMSSRLGSRFCWGWRR